MKPIDLIVASFVLLVSCYQPTASLSCSYPHQVGYFPIQLDHFDFTNNATYSMRVLFNYTFHSANGPVFFYTGNEGSIDLFCNNTGFLWELAPQYGAAVIFAEHRYYGESMPFGNESFSTPAKTKYLTSEQTLADYAEFLTTLKKTNSAFTNSPVVAFGGSYGGMLAAWFRMKYPNVVIGSLASSAPIWMFPGMADCRGFNQVVTRDYGLTSPDCPTCIRKSWDILNRLGATDAGRKLIGDTMTLCSPLKSVSDVNDLKGWMADTWGSMAMIDYPYPASFLAPVPGFPVKVTCQRIDAVGCSDDTRTLQAMRAGLDVYYNYTGQIKCFDIEQGSSPDLGADAWDYQTCTEMVLPICADGKQDMFEPSPWNYTNYAQQCLSTWQTTPRWDWPITYYGGRDIQAASNIIFSNGQLDPWSSGGVLSNVNPSVVAITIPSGAHHLDLRASNPQDPQDVTLARTKEKKIIRDWLNQFYARKGIRRPKVGKISKWRVRL